MLHFVVSSSACGALRGTQKDTADPADGRFGDASGNIYHNVGSALGSATIVDALEEPSAPMCSSGIPGLGSRLSDTSPH